MGKINTTVDYAYLDTLLLATTKEAKVTTATMSVATTNSIFHRFIFNFSLLIVLP